MPTTDGQVIRECLSGEPEAFGFLVDKYRQSIYAFAYSKLCDFHDAEDVAQEVFITAYRKLGTLKYWDNFLGWLYSITSNLCKNFKRSQSRRPDREFLSDLTPEALNEQADAAYQSRLAYEPLYEALDELSESYRQVLTLHYLGSLSTKEIARFIGTSPNNIAQRLVRARAELKEEMIDTMSATFSEMRLQPEFTFRVVEAIKQTNIAAPPSKMTLPFGVSVAAGLIAVMLSLTIPQSPLNPITMGGIRPLTTREVFFLNPLGVTRSRTISACRLMWIREISLRK